MGWRDINMNRRKPKLQLAFISQEPGLSRTAAIIRKAAAEAVAAFGEQSGGNTVPAHRAFAVGYLFGYAKQAAARLGLDCETPDGQHLLQEIAAHLASLVPPALEVALRDTDLAPRHGAGAAFRSRWRPEAAEAPAEADAGYLVGQLEAVCGTRLLFRALESAATPDAYFTLCDRAADRLQTHQPTLSIRLTIPERSVVAEGLPLPARA